MAAWPQPDASRLNTAIEEQFAQFHAVLSALREIRSRQNVPSRQTLSFALRCDERTAALLQPLTPLFAALAEADALDMGPAVQPPATNATVHLPNLDVYVDLSGVIDVEAEILRLEKQLERLSGMIVGKEKKLGNTSFLEKAPAECRAQGASKPPTAARTTRQRADQPGGVRQDFVARHSDLPDVRGADNRRYWMESDSLLGYG